MTIEVIDILPRNCILVTASCIVRRLDSKGGIEFATSLEDSLLAMTVLRFTIEIRLTRNNRATKAVIASDRRERGNLIRGIKWNRTST
jgi:hypothetical protein